MNNAETIRQLEDVAERLAGSKLSALTDIATAYNVGVAVGTLRILAAQLRDQQPRDAQGRFTRRDQQPLRIQR